MQQERQHKSKRESSRSDTSQPSGPANVAAKSKLEETDELLRDIDQTLAETLERSGETAEQFVNRYRQRGGQ